MARKPAHTTLCFSCKRRVGVQREYNLSGRADFGLSGWRVSRHAAVPGVKGICVGSRVEVTEDKVDRGRLVSNV